MDQPRQLLNRVKRFRAHPATPPRGVPSPAPAPAQSAYVDAVTPPPAPVAPSPAPAAQTPRRPSGHALYSQVMKRHDRMGTRHV